MDNARYYCVSVDCLHTGSPTGEQLAAARRLLQTNRFAGASLDCRGVAIRLVADVAAIDEIDACARTLAAMHQAFAAPEVAWGDRVARTRTDVIRITEARTMTVTFTERTPPEHAPLPHRQPEYSHTAAAA